MQRKYNLQTCSLVNIILNTCVGVIIFAFRVLAYGTKYIKSSSLLQSLMHGHLSTCSFCDMCSLKPCKILCTSIFIICKYFTFMLENSLLVMFCIALYPTLNIFTYLFTYLFSILLSYLLTDVRTDLLTYILTY